MFENARAAGLAVVAACALTSGCTAGSATTRPPSSAGRADAAPTHPGERMSIKVIIEFRAKPGQRGELLRTLEALVADQGRGLEGYRGSTRFEVVDDPDLLVEIAEWTTVEARAKHLEEAKATGAFGRVFELLAGPPKATVVREASGPAAR